MTEAEPPRSRLKGRTRELILAAALIMAASALTLVHYQGQPLTRTTVTTLCTYTHRGAYAYEANLTRNLFYNRTRLHPGEGPLYTAIVQSINITYAYDFSSTPAPTEATHETSLRVFLEAGDAWSKELTNAEAQRLLRPAQASNLSLTVEVAEALDMFQTLAKETGAGSPAYTIRIVPVTRTRAEIAGHTVDETFAHELAVTFARNDATGRHVRIQDLTRTQQGSITNTETQTIETVREMRGYSLLSSTTSAGALLIASIHHLRNRKGGEKKPSLRSILKDHGDLIVRSGSPVRAPRTVDLESMDDLARLSELLSKPAIHTREAGAHAFTVLDRDTAYRYTHHEEA